MTKPIASLSLDLDNKWAYLRTHGIESWKKYPSYLAAVVPRILRFCAERELRITCFVIGRDAERPENFDALAALSAAGHEIANHSHNHYPWLHTLDREEVEAEICEAEEHIERATGRVPIGFRGPGYSLSNDVLEFLAARGYFYDASTLPTYIGPLARWYFRRTATDEAAERADRRAMFGKWRDGLRPLKPYAWETASGPLIEIPVTTFPIIKLPIHMTYLLHLWRLSPRLTRLYLNMALTACRRLGVGPSILLHPLDFLGAEDEPELRFFPGMNVPRSEKSELLEGLAAGLAKRFELVPMCEHADIVGRQLGIARPRVAPIQAPAEPLFAAARRNNDSRCISNLPSIRDSMKSIIHKRFADNTSSDSVATRLRRQRFQILLDMVQKSPGIVSILDIGGTFEYWQMMAGDSDLFDRIHVTLLNLQPRDVPHPHFDSVVGDGRSMPQFDDLQFDVVFSNSCIEHVGDFDDQMRMASEIRRIGRQYYVQTPNRYFPIEPHFVFPFFQFLPLATRAWLVQHYKLGWCPKIPDRQSARREVESIRLLSRAEMQELFPDATIYEERFYGFVKSFVAHTRQPLVAAIQAPEYAAAP